MGLNIVDINVFLSTYTNVFFLILCHVFTFFNAFYIFERFFLIYSITSWPSDCNHTTAIIRPNLLSTPETLDNWTDGRISCRQLLLALATLFF